MNTESIPSTRPYLVRAIYDWCVESGYTPHIAVAVNESVRVPMEHVKEGEIVLNISMDATSALKLGNEYIEFKARFGGVAREIRVPVEQVLAIFARENGQGMAFPRAPSSVARPSEPEQALDAQPPTPPRDPGRPTLTRIK